MKYDIFLSYRRHDVFKALTIYNELIAYGLHVFMDISELKSGTYEQKIHDAINSCTCFLVIVKEDTFKECQEELNYDHWVEKECKWAIQARKAIIPILFNHYKWPNDQKNLSDIEKQLANLQSITFSDEYQEASFKKLSTYLNENGCKITKMKKNTITYSSNDIELNEFIQVNMQYIDEIETLQLAFHAGTDWYSEFASKYRYLLALHDKNAKIQILINSSDAAELIGKHMRLTNFLYISFDQAIKQWKDIKLKMLPNVEIRVSDISLMHAYCCFEMCCNYESQMMIHYYTYGNSDPTKNFDALFDGRSPYFDLYQKEFMYLWEKAIPIQLYQD